MVCSDGIVQYFTKYLSKSLKYIRVFLFKIALEPSLFGGICTGKSAEWFLTKREEKVIRKSLKTMLGISALCLGFAALPANAFENRAAGFSIPCDFQPHTVFLVGTGLGTASTRFIQGAEIAVTSNAGALQFLTMSVPNTNAGNLIVLAAGNNHQARDYTGFYSVPNNGGTITVNITGTCNAGSGPTVDGIAVINFFS